jgi:hypothetical protein
MMAMITQGKSSATAMVAAFPMNDLPEAILSLLSLSAYLRRTAFHLPNGHGLN